VLGGLASTSVTFTVFNVALVDIAGNLHTSSGVLTWSVTGPLLIVGVAAPILGRLGDMYGHRKLYIYGLVGSLACAALTAVSWNVEVLIAARLLSGVGGAAMGAASWALLFSVSSRAERTRVLGWWSLVSAGAPVVGVAIGGPVVQVFGWRWIFIAQVPLILAALVANFVVLQETERHGREALDLGGAVLLATGVASLLICVEQYNSGLTSPLVMACAGLAVVSFPVFWAVERRAKFPVMPLEWFSMPSVALPCLASFGVNFAYMGGFFVTPLFMEQALGYSVGTAGLFQIARPLVFAVAAPAAAVIAARRGDRSAAVAGGLVLVASMLGFVAVAPGSPGVVILVALGASGLANGISTPSLGALVAGAVDNERLGSASAVVQLASQVGVVAGIQVMESVQASFTRSASLVGSYHYAYVAGGVAALAATVVAVAIRPARPGRVNRAVYSR
jgi:MFS family permease